MLDVIILNAYHRGDWLIERLQGSRHAIEALDVSDLVGLRDDEDIHGPFGFFEGSDPVAEEWLLRTRQLKFQKAGWVLWSSDGTFESSGPLRERQAQMLSQNQDLVLKSFLSTTDRPAQIHRAQPAMVSETTKGYFLTERVLVPREARRTVKASDAFHLSAIPGQKTIRWNEHTFESQFVVSFLLPHELMALAPKGLGLLLSGEPLRPRTCWQRARFRVETSFQLSSLPDQLTLVDALQEPWLEENMLVLQRTKTNTEWDVWFRSWYDVHKDKKYFSGLQKRIQTTPNKKMPDATITCIQAPLETTERHAHTLYPVYDHGEWLLSAKWFTNGVFAGALDKCEKFSATEVISVQRRILNQIDEELKGG